MAGTSLRARARASESRWVWSLVALGAALLARVRGTGRWYLRRGLALERLGRHADARAAFAAAVVRPGARPDWYRHLAAAHERAGDPAAAARAWLEAVAAVPRRDDWCERLTASLARVTDAADAVRVHEEAMARLEDRLPRERVATLRSGLARADDRVGSWSDACRLLRANVAADPRDAVSHRELARVSERMGNWHGDFAGGTAGLEALRFRPCARTPGDEAGVALLAEARDSLERAVALEPGRWAWRGALGRLREAAGDLEGAIACYEALVEREQASNRRSAFRALHEWQFALERAHHRAGRPRVSDPLFDAAAAIEPADLVAPGERPVGLFDARWTFGGLAVSGLLTAPEVETVEVVLDDRVLRTANVASGGFFPRFGQALQRDALEHAPPQGTLRVRTGAGAPLLALGRAETVRLSVPHGSGRLLRILDEGGHLDKKGGFAATVTETRERQDAYLRLYEAVRDAVADTVGPLLLIHGTLLGVHREGDLIPGDDDFDVAYVSRGTDPVAVKREAQEHMLALVRAGFTVSFNRSGRLFRVGLEGIGDATLHLDVHPIWFEDGRAWLHNDVSIPARPDDFLPCATARLRGTGVHVPRRPEVFLEGHYGPGWRVPDPGFMNHRSEIDPAVLAHLDRALIAPAEYRELRAELERRPGPRGDPERLVSIGSQPLYPLEGRVL